MSAAAQRLPAFDDSGWELIDTPHDMLIGLNYSSEGDATEGARLPRGSGWYVPLHAPLHTRRSMVGRSMVGRSMVGRSTRAAAPRRWRSTRALFHTEFTLIILFLSFFFFPGGTACIYSIPQVQKEVSVAIRLDWEACILAVGRCVAAHSDLAQRQDPSC